MADQPAKPDQLSLSILVRGAEKIFDNAERLFVEADALAKLGAIPRALFLHQISLEECSKISIIGAWAISLFLGKEVDQRKILRAFGRHAAKNKHNAYMLEVSDAEKAARASGDWKGSLDAFRRVQDEFHEASNEAKNASLYVDMIDGEFVAPKERITGEMLAEIKALNSTFLGYAYHETNVFRRLDKTPDVMRELLAGFVEKAEKLKDEKPDNLIEALDELMVGFFEEGKSKLSERGAEPAK